MTKITAIGQKWGHRTTVQVSRERKGQEIKILFNGKDEPCLLSELETALDMAPLMANCYQPPKDSMLAYYNALSACLFEKMENIEVKGQIEQIPTYKEVVVY